jgi:outer membrane receptor protein involved in Fe transport
VLLALFGLSAAFGQSNQGEVQIYIFSEDGQPLEGVVTEANGETYESNSSGLINFTHPPGTHEFTLIYQGSEVAQVSVPVRQGQATEAIITARRGEGKAAVDTGRAEDIREMEEDRQEIDPDAPTGTLQGSVTHIETGEAITNATIIFREVDFETTTNEEGLFSANLPEGDYSFSVIHPDFSSQTQDEVGISVGETTEVAIELTPAAIQLEEVPVFATEEIRVQGGIANLIDETRNSGVVLNLIGQEQISRTGDADAASALRRVTGLTVVDGRFVYVRGMGERYSSSYLNGAALPSPELDKRVVPLDLFPTEVIESMAIQKSYSPDLRGDFGGGAINLRSIGIPDDRYKRRLRTVVNTSIGYNLGTAFTEQLVAQPGSLDWIGVDDGTRKLPDDIDEYDERIFEESLSGIGGGLPPEEVERLGESLSGRWDPEEQLLPLDYSGSISVRDKIEIGTDRSFGFNGAVSYSNSWSAEERRERTFETAAGSGYRTNSDYEVDRTSRDVDISALLDLAYKHSSDLDFKSTSLLIRATDNVVEQYQGGFLDSGLDLKFTEQSWVEQTLYNQSLGGNVGLGILNQADFGWQYTFSLANRYEPDQRYLIYQDDNDDGNFEEDNQRLYVRSFAAQKLHSSVRDYVHDGQLDLSVPIFWFNDASSDFIDVGSSVMYQTRETDTRRFAYEVQGELVNTPEEEQDLTEEPDELFQDENIGTDDEGEFLQFEEKTIASDNYRGEHLILGGYLSTDILLFDDLRMNSGARVEYSEQTVEVIDLFTGEAEEPAVLETVDVLPAVNFTWPLTDKMQVRLGGSRTVNRPDLQELSPTQRFGPPGTGSTFGNPDLKKATIYNADVRWEAYLAERESVALGAFYKYFQDPIEVQQIPGPSFPTTYTNVPRAYNVGGELEWALQFRFVSDVLRDFMVGLDFDSLERERRWRRRLGSVSSFFRDLRTTGNVSVIQSQIDYAGEDRGANTSNERPLQGQSPYVVNASLGYKNSVSWSQDRQTYTSLFLNYNVFGPRILALGTQGVPDIYEQPFHQLDLVFKHQFNLYFSIGFKAKNLLNLPAQQTLGEAGDLVQEYRKGRSFSISGTLDL